MPPFAAEIDLAAIRANVAELRRRAGESAVMAVVKADGYGHGMLPCARAAIAGGASWLGVAFIEEAVTLRDAGIDVPLLAWLLSPHTDLRPAALRSVDVSISAEWALELAAAAARGGGGGGGGARGGGGGGGGDPCPSQGGHRPGACRRDAGPMAGAV